MSVTKIHGHHAIQLQTVMRLFPGKTAAPSVNDDITLGYVASDVWLDETNDKSYQCLDNTDGAAVWKEITGGITGVAWGDITGTLSSQSDLNTALNGKQPLDSDLTAIATLSPADDDVIQRKSGAWTNRTAIQLLADLMAGAFQTSGDITPTALSADQNNYNPTGLSTATVLRLEASGANRSITGLAGGSDGRIIVIHNVGSTYTLFLIDESTSSDADKRFALNGTIDITPDSVVMLQYDSTSIRWRSMNTSAAALQGTPITAGLKSSLADLDILRWHAGDGSWQRNTHLSDTSNPHSTTAAQVAAIPNDGWIAGGGGTWSYTSADAPSFVASVPDADAALFAVGWKIKLTQTSAKYFVVTAKGTPSGGFTPVTIYGGTDYTLANAAISSPYFSPEKSPLNFPMDPDKWTVVTTNTNACSKSSPTADVWYGDTGLSSTGPSISIPIGAWYVEYQGLAQIVSNLGAVGNLGVRLTLSTASNSQSDANNTRDGLATLPISTTAQFRHTATLIPKIISLAAKTTYYLNILTSQSSVTTISIAGNVQTTVIRARCAYI